MIDFGSAVSFSMLLFISIFYSRQIIIFTFIFTQPFMIALCWYTFVKSPKTTSFPDSLLPVSWSDGKQRDPGNEAGLKIFFFFFNNRAISLALIDGELCSIRVQTVEMT